MLKQKETQFTCLVAYTTVLLILLLLLLLLLLLQLALFYLFTIMTNFAPCDGRLWFAVGCTRHAD